MAHITTQPGVFRQEAWRVAAAETIGKHALNGAAMRAEKALLREVALHLWRELSCTLGAEFALAPPGATGETCRFGKQNLVARPRRVTALAQPGRQGAVLGKAILNHRKQRVRGERFAQTTGRP